MRSALKRFCILFSFLACAVEARAECTRPFNLLLLGGIRYEDGFGDHALNKSVIDRQISRLKGIDPKCVQIHVGFFDERSGTSFRGLEANRIIFNDPHYTRAIDALEKGSARSTGVYYDPEMKIRFWREEKLERLARFGTFSEKFDLAVMVSGTQFSLPDSPGYHPPDWLYKTNLVVFDEYSGYPHPRYPQSPKKRTMSLYVHTGKENRIQARLASGFDTVGILIDDPPAHLMTAKEIRALILKESQTAHPRIKVADIPYARSPLNQLKHVLGSDKLRRVVGYFSESGPYYTALADAALLAYADSQYYAKMHPGKALPKFLFVTNMKHHQSIDQLLGNVPSSMDPDYVRSAKEFLRENAVFVSGDGMGFTTNELRSLMNPKTGAVFTQVGGYGTLNDAYSVGSYPAFHRRDYHLLSTSFIQEEAAKLVPEAERAEFERFRSNYMGRRMTREQVERVAKGYSKWMPYFEKAIEVAKRQKNLHSYIDDVVDRFAVAKRKDPKNVMLGLMEDAVETADAPAGSKTSPFLKMLVEESEYLPKGAMEKQIDCLMKHF